MENSGMRASEQSGREHLQTLFDSAFRDGDGKRMREQYRALRAFERKYAKEQPSESVEISYLAENVTMAADIIVSETKKNFVYCGNDTSPIIGNTRLISKALLEILSNAFLYGKGNLVTVKTAETKTLVTLEVQSGGRFCFNEADGGLEYVRKLCRFLGARFFIKTDIVSSSAVISFEKAKRTGDVSRCPDFFELLSDRLSPVYVEFFGL